MKICNAVIVDDGDENRRPAEIASFTRFPV